MLISRLVAVGIILTILISGLNLALGQGLSSCAPGMLERQTYQSGWLGQPMQYNLYLPPCYDSEGGPYPLLVLMHGSNEDDGQWPRMSLIEHLDRTILAGDVPPVVLVMPFGNVIANRNRFDNISWGNIFVTELLPHVASLAHITTDRSLRAIGGISRGGFWAYQIAFSHPDLFGTVGGHSAFFDRFHAPAEANPLDLAATVTAYPWRLWLDHGAEDFAAPGLALMHDRLTAAGLAHTYLIQPSGQHNNAYWSQHLATYIEWYTEGWRVPQPTQPVGFATNTPLAPPAVTATQTPASSTMPGDETFAWWVPVVGWPSLQTSLPSTSVQAVARGDYDPNLILRRRDAEALRSLGVAIHPQTRVVEEDRELVALLWRARSEPAYSLLRWEEMPLRLRPLWLDDVPLREIPPGYPLAFEAATGFNSRRQTFLTISGVTALTRNTRIALDAVDLDWAAEGIRPYTTASDYFHVSHEVSFVPGCPQTSERLLGGVSSFCADPAHFDWLVQIGVNVVELSGNHNNDYGYDAYRQTFLAYQAEGWHTVGGGLMPDEARQPLILTHHGNRIGWIACNDVGPYYALVNDDPSLLGGIRPGAAPCQDEWLRTTLAALRDEVDIVLVTIQYQEYESHQPAPEQRWRFRQMADWGADVVIGTSEHKPQPFEFYTTRRGDDAFIHYGLGNFLFDQPFWGNVRFFLDTLIIHEGRLLAIELFPGIIEDMARPRLMTPEERLNFLFFMMIDQGGY